ncbi:hypothetical protein CHS0354_013623 [Potamilus streckersoni]|uniref:Gamma-glutamylcyclotransferase n=1 Tax=Potamilus streckersoni TaxID=2493646 RepID=A0AAE0SL39_9BIVA|nr:hypothetical protein CHS0354_013623 [Potamilus streckersoni]
MSARSKKSQVNASGRSGSGKDTVNFMLAPNQVSTEDPGKDASVFVLDPDLQKEEDLPEKYPSDSQRNKSGGQRQSSGRMSRESQSSKRTDVSDASRIVKSRSRPKKEHESDPFLSIDNLPQDATFVSEKSQGLGGVRRGRPAPPKSPSLITWPRASAYATPFSHNSGPASDFHQLKRKAATRPNSFRSSSTSWLRTSYSNRAGNITPTQMNYVSPNKEQKSPNYHVKMPFKHAVNKPDMRQDGVTSPSQELKERTALAIYHINRILSLDDQPDAKKKHGRLQKAKLKPLYPVSIEGPSITQCRGIVSDAHSYGPSASRTLQRRQQLLKQIPNVHEYLYDRPHTVESLHQTSIASSGDDNNDNGAISDESFDSNRSLPDEILYTTPKSVFELDKQNTRVNIPTTERGDITNGSADTVQPSSREITPTPRMFVTEINSKSEKIDAELAGHLQNDSPVKKTNEDEIITEKNSSAEMNPVDRPSSVEGTSNRGKSPYKSVRFVEDAHSKEIKQLKNAKIAEQQLKLSQKNDLNIMDLDEKKKSLAKKGNMSCKDDASKENEHWDKDDDNDDDKNNRKLKDGRGTDDSAVEKVMNNVSSSKGGNSENKISDSSETKGKKTSITSKESQDENDSVLQNLERAKVQHCSRFSQSQVSAVLRPLQVQTVLHGDAIHNVICAENRSRSPSPNRQNPSRFKLNNSVISSHEKEQEFLFFSHKDIVKSGTEDFDYTVSRPKVKFQLESDKCEEYKSSIFWERDTGDEILIQGGTDINFDTLDSELELLKTSIQKNLSKEKELDEGLEIVTLIEENTNNEESKCKVSPREESPFIDRLNLSLSKDLNSDRGNTSNVAADSVRDGGYSDLLKQYRQRCIQNWEHCGEISSQSNQDDAITKKPKMSSAGIIKPKRVSSAGIIRPKRMSSANSDKQSRDSDTNQDSGVKDIESSQGSQLNSYRSQRLENYRGRSLSLDEGCQRKCQSVKREVLDSGCGSEDTLSEMSGTITAVSDVPHLNLGSLSNDLALAQKNDKMGDVNSHKGQNLLDMVCDHLPNAESQKLNSEASEEMNPLLRLKKLRQRPKVGEERTSPDFQLVATAKMLSKPRNQKKDRAGPAPPFPPLYFSINARPPRDYLYYFAYGPEMNPDRFSMYIHRQIQTRFWGTLFGFSLVFNKRGSDLEAGGFANIEFNPFSSVEGCIFRITQDELVFLDKYMGYPKHYEHLVLPVMMCNSLDPEQYGVAQYCVPALTYIAQDDWTEKDITLNCDYSVKQSLKGGDLLTPEYRNFLSNKLTTTITQEVMA